MATPNSPYAPQRKALQLTVIWFLIPMVALGIVAPLVEKNIPSASDSMVLPLFALGVAILFAGIGYAFGIKPLQDSLADHKDLDSNLSKSKIITTGAIFEIPAITGVIAWLFFKVWWVYAFGIAALAAVVFLVLMPSVTKLYDLLELLLQRKNDGGTVAVAKKTTYEL
ncbi:MAG: hypothetical protein KF824_02160 [Fimbriimonadaceae bacterium]|nr:MAG: hypothetical protein KF824_02160 [Fimbriimonadaceae bacterium]